MHPEAYHRLARRQNEYWWHQARRAMCLALLRRNGVNAGCRCVELGCGPGGNFQLFTPLQPDMVVGVDVSPLALEYAAKTAPGVDLVRANLAQRLPFRDGFFDVGTVFNVLYHEWVPRESLVLAELARILRPGGIAVVTEPAFPWLAREMDVTGMGRTRYRLGEFRALCRDAGLDVVLSNYFTSFGAALLIVKKLAATFGRGGKEQKKLVDPDMQPISPMLNTILRTAALVEAQAIIRRVPIPFGTTLICIARKQASTAAAI